MGEVGIIMSSEETMEMMFEKEEQEIEMEMKKEISSSKSVIRWENFLPRMFIRVLLVEADDSTRQIISALLKKCGYRVTAVCDGSKAWDILHGTSHNIDIVLTEVELPSKSGFSLLSMITDNESCKNIPVIMMSTHDSIGVVFKCMIKGASDFLIKPVRKNELRNLWQHVWRKHNSSSSSNGVQGGSCPQQNVGVPSENNTVSNTTDSRASTRNNKECSDKESDAQSSSIKPDVEAGIAYINETDCMVVEEDHISERQTSPSKKGENAHCQTKNGDNEQIEPRREAIDLIGSFDDRQRTCCVVREVFCNNSKTYSDSIDTTNKFDLSLRRSEHSDFGYQQTDERRALKRSNFSAFSPYNNSMVHPLYASNNLSNQSLIDRPSQAMTSFPSPQLGFFPIPNQDKGTSFDSFNSGFGPPFPHILSTQSCPSLLWNQNSVSHQKSAIVDNLSSQSNSESENFEHFRELHDPNDGICTDQLTHEQPNSDADYAENRVSVAPNTAQSGTSSLCNGASSHVYRNGCGTIDVNVAKDEGLLVHGGLRGMDPLRFTQREIALNKFRLKRKERCFEKKVRYQSRKKLAEQRPRVKGQFVRQAI